MHRKIVSTIVFVLALTFAVHSAKAASADDYEPNDEFSEAGLVSFENGKINVNGSIQSRNDDDYYLFHLSKPGKIAVSINRNLSTSYRVTLYNSNQKEVESYYTSYGVNKGPDNLFSQGLDAGAYYVRVDYHDGNEKEVPYNLLINYTQSNYVEKEKNNDQANANIIRLNKVYSGWADQWYNDDYFAFQVPASGEVEVKMDKSLKTKYEVDLLDSNGNRMEGWYTSFGKEKLDTIIHIGLPKGLYYLKIRTTEGNVDNIPYRFLVKFKLNTFFELENNDSMATANPLTLNKATEGILKSEYDEDYFSINLTKNTNIALYISAAKKTRFQMRFFKQDELVNKWIYTNYGNGKLQNISNLNLKKGLYYVRVERYEGAYTQIPYTLKIAQRDTTPPAVPAVNKVTSSSNKVTGKAEKGSTVYVYRGKTKLGQGTVPNTGKFTVNIKKQKKGTAITIYAKDKAGNKGKSKTIKVQ